MAEERIRLSAKTTLAEQLSKILLDEIRTASPGHKILPERKLAEKHNVSRKTARAAISRLARSGLLDRKVGKGSFVAGKTRYDPCAPAVLLNFTDIFPYHALEAIAQKLNKGAATLDIKYFHGSYTLVDTYIELAMSLQDKGEALDVISVDEGILPILAEKKLIAPLDDLLDKSKQLKTDHFHPALIDAFSHKNAIYGVPQTYTTAAVFYNKALLDGARLPHPSDDWSWDDLLRIATTLTVTPSDGSRNAVYGFGFSPLHINTVMPFLYQNLDASASFEDKVSSGNNIAETLGFLRDLIYRHKACPPFHDDSRSTLAQLFADGVLGMFLGFYKDYRLLKDDCAFEWGMASLPGKRRKATCIPAQGWGISSKSVSRMKSFNIIEQLLEQENTEVLCRDLKRIPAYDAASFDLPEVFIRSLDHAIPSTKLFPDSTRRKAFLIELLHLFNNFKNVEDASERVARLLNPIKLPRKAGRS